MSLASNSLEALEFTMSIKPDAKSWRVKEQIVEDPSSDLTFQFEVMPDGSPRLRVFGDSLPFGNREIIFNSNGNYDGGGTYTAAACKPSWLHEVDL